MSLNQERRSWLPFVPTLLLVGLSLLSTVPFASAQTFVTLRLIDAESGKPLKGISVSVMIPDAVQSRDLNKEAVSLIVVKIDKEGVGKFTLPEPPPQYVQFASNGALHGCSERRFSTEDVLAKGLIAAYHYDPKRPTWCPELKAKASTKPGEIVIFDKPITGVDRILSRQY